MNYKNRYNLIFIFLSFVVFISIVSFFRYQIRELPDSLPESLEKTLKEECSKWEPVFLENALMDGLIGHYPDINFFAGDGKSKEIAGSYNQFCFLSIEEIPSVLNKLSNYNRKEIANGCS